jgi:hypothetical protein
VCAGHDVSLHQAYAEPKVRRGARAKSRDEVWRKLNPKVRDDEQEPDMRCGTPGASWHVTTESSIRGWGVLYKSGVYSSLNEMLSFRGDINDDR